MAVLAPLNNATALPRLHAAGVGEIYVGFHDADWNERFGNAELNRMSGFGKEANPFSFEQMCEQLRAAHELGMRAFVCFNASQYSAAQTDFIAQTYLPRIAEAHGSGIIVSGQGLSGQARTLGLGVVISTVAGAFNARLARHYLERGATRVILPRDLSSDEIAGIVRAVPQLEYEAFLMRNGCVFSDSHCLGKHCAGNPSLCLSLREGDMRIRAAGQGSHDGWAETGHDPIADGAGEAAEADARLRDFVEHAYENERVWAESYHRRTCGLCALWRFEQLGIAAYKVVGRGDDVDDLVADASLVARNSALARTCGTEREYFSQMERPRHPQTLCGTRGLSCYYPEAARW